uniref:Transposon protein, putative, CACTA, En/Spm sub-class n=2 Tax=Oryza sativa subsp. japonica TaxID=39947 RepID=Q2R6M3_ORYSJ|nr:transposon protein, putative, CACTA, En/Spm sub-class [Oryza sativa Japonica Group]AAX96421.1 transposon protein, putative, CACTA, En/Spm sub-class [Oryza sativa Japonica Group]ABA92930.1 transposon protein, putative, CACTA, En/Spm sub-class [Oryza sativa Japonica Group]
MADRDEEQILYDTIAEGSNQYWNEEEVNEDPNQYLNEEGNVERDAEGNEERDAEGNEEGNGQTLNFNTFPKLRDHWDEFVAYKIGQQGQAMMDRNKENAAKKKYHHHLGSGGYSLAMLKWEEMEASLIERGIEPATAKWPNRSKFWYYTHGGTLNPVDGSLVFSDQIREAASRLTDAVEASSQGTSRMRRKRDTEAKIADLEYRVSSYKLSMQDEVARRVDERMAAHRSHDPQPYIPPAMVSPSGNRSSCVSTGQDETTCPVDEITQRTPCELHIPFKNLSIKVASGMAIPTDPSGTYHCRPIPVGYSRIEVELVEAAYEDLELDYPGGDAPSMSRSHQDPPPTRTRATKKAKVDAAENKEPPYNCTQEELDAYVVAEVKRMEIQRARRRGVFDTGFIDPQKCTKQDQGTNLCGYYVCEYCHCLTTQIITTRELDVIRMRDNLRHKEFIAAVQEQLMGFINEQVLDPEGEFYYNGNTIHKSLASEITTTTSKL